ncbi:hypothetical protein [Streptosporangium sp. NPDC051022]|uniref:hypothetical protein n=1 Tax=Streptosporangium sp. NPDC051022 TaxID=3155752 RepID=UPI00342375CC
MASRRSTGKRRTTGRKRRRQGREINVILWLAGAALAFVAFRAALPFLQRPAAWLDGGSPFPL